MGKSQGISTVTSYAVFTRFSAFACTWPELALRRFVAVWTSSSPCK